ISGNSVDGVNLEFGTSNNFVCRNLIGFNSNGLAFLPNQRHGVALFNASHNTNGLPGGGNNFIVGNLSNGVFIGRGALTSGSVSNRVQGNVIATNGLDGVQLNDGANGNEIFGNLIGGN